MNATKRKFNTLLQGLGSSRSRTTDDTSPSSRTAATASPSSTPTKTLDPELLQKRRRLGLPDSTAPVLKNLPRTISAALKATDSQPIATPRKEAPARYAPTERGDLLKRLATFQELTDWTPKPERVSEIEWAKRGWVCHGKETVRCMLCHKELVVKLNRKVVDGKEVPVLIPSEIEEALVDKYVDLIGTAHKEECLWRKRGCDDSLIRLSLAKTAPALEGLRERYDELCSRKSFLPYQFNLRLPDDFDLEEIISLLPPDFFTNPAPVGDKHPDRVALALALLGWQGLTNPRIGQVPNSASCQTCLRRLGLWMFKSKEVSDSGEVIVPAPMDFLDPIREHRFFCPWANPETQRQGVQQSQKEEAKPGWKILAQTLANDAHLRNIYEGKPSARARPRATTAGAPSTPKKPGTAASTPRRPGTAASAATPTPHTPGGESIATTDYGSPYVDDEDDKERDAKDKERWARLRRVKSLFDSKGARKLKNSISRSRSRPGTAHSTKSTKSTKSIDPQDQENATTNEK